MAVVFVGVGSEKDEKGVRKKCHGGGGDNYYYYYYEHNNDKERQRDEDDDVGSKSSKVALKRHRHQRRCTLSSRFLPFSG